MRPATDPGTLNWLVDDLVRRLPGAARAIVLSSDGLLIGRSHSFRLQDAEHLSAVASGLQSLARGAARHFGGGRVQQTVVEMEEFFLVVTSAGRGACLAVLASTDADMGLVAYEMNVMVRRVGAYLSADPRNEGNEGNEGDAGRPLPGTGRAAGHAPGPGPGPGPGRGRS